MQVRAPDLDDFPLSQGLHAPLSVAPDTLLLDPGGQGVQVLIFDAPLAVE